MTDPNTANAYLQTKVMSASPEELRLMLIDGALKFATQGRDGLTSDDHEQAYLGFSQCRPILLELINTISPEPDPQLAERVKSLYSFMFTELAESSHNRDIERVNKVIALLEYERETWVMLMEKLLIERHAPTDDTGSTEPVSNQSFSVQG